MLCREKITSPLWSACRNATPPRAGAQPELLASPRPGARQVAPPLKARRGTAGALQDARLAAARRGTQAAEDGPARPGGRHAAADEPQHQARLLCRTHS